MAAKANKTKSKLRSAVRTKANRTKSKPLLAEPGFVRSSKPKARGGSDVLPTAFVVNPALAMVGLMGRVMGAYAELPVRLAQCRSPMDLWVEQARFAQLIFSACQSTTPSGSSPDGDASSCSRCGADTC